MINQKSTPSLNALLLCLAVIIPAPVRAQTRRTPRDVVIETNRQEMDTLLLRKPILTARDLSARMALLKQIGEDFRELQVLNNKLMDKATSSEQPDYKYIVGLLARIITRAQRLRTNLALPSEPNNEKQSGLEVTSENRFQMELSKLDQAVVSFANNPIFKETKVVDVQLGAKANKDLALIIDQAGRLKKAGSKLEKQQRR